MIEKAVLHKHNQQRQQNLQEVLWFQWKRCHSESRDILLIKYVTIYFLLHMQTEVLLMISATHYVYSICISTFKKEKEKPGELKHGKP